MSALVESLVLAIVIFFGFSVVFFLFMELFSPVIEWVLGSPKEEVIGGCGCFILIILVLALMIYFL